MKRPLEKPKAKKARRRVGTLAAMALCLAAVAGIFIATAYLKRMSTASHAAERFVARPRGELTFNKHIAPILFRNCAGCHRPGESAPFSLLTYQQVKARA